MKGTKRTNKALAVTVILMMVLTAAAALFSTPLETEAAGGNTLVVTNGNDSGAGSLRYILGTAADGDTIMFDASVTTVTLTSGEISFGQANITIEGGAGVTITKIPAGNFRLLNSTSMSGKLTLKSLTIENGKVTTGTTGGGGVYVRNEAVLNNCTFFNNSANLNGGGIYVDVHAYLIGCTFSNNEADRGGGAYANGATITDCTFANNTAQYGGGFCGGSTIDITRCTFITNAASQNGGGMYVSNADLTDCTFINNRAENSGGGVQGVSLQLINCGFSRNSSVLGTVFAGNITAINCTFFNNIINSPVQTGVIILTSTSSYSSTLVHCTLTNNVKAGPGTTYNVSMASNITVRNCLMTRDGLDGTGITVPGNDLSGTYSSKFGTNVMTFNYIMPLPGAVVNAVLDSTCTTDAAGNTRTGANCLYGAVNWTAVSWIVTNNNDSGAGSLRQCLADADAYSTSPLPNKRVVYFADTIAGGNTITVASGFDWINNDLMIIGRIGNDGKPAITIDGNNSDTVIRSISYEHPAIHLYGLKMMNANNASLGGFIRSYGPLYAEACEFRDNTAQSGAAMYAEGVVLINCSFSGNTSVSTVSGSAGVLSLAGASKLINCTFYNNSGNVTSYLSGGAITMTNCNFFNNTATGGNGGGAYCANPANLTNCTFAYNKATVGKGGGVYFNASTTMTDCTIIGNDAIDGGGVYAYNNLILTNCTFSANKATGAGATHDGGGAYANAAVAVTDCTFSNNEAVRGGGAYANAAATMDCCIFSGNTGINNGGGVYVRSAAIMTNCNFSNNKSTTNYGSAIFGNAAESSIMANCTVSGNSSTNNNSCAIDFAGSIYLLQCTVTDNKGGGIYANSGNSVYLYNSIVTGNTNAAGTALLQTVGSGSVYDSTSLIEGKPAPGTTTNVTNRQVFGPNTFDPATGTQKVLTNGIANGTATAIPGATVDGILGLTNTQKDALKLVLANDQTGAARATSGSVTYGAVEASANTLDSIDFNPTSRTFYTGDTFTLTGIVLTLTYSDGSSQTIDWNEIGLTWTPVDMNTSGNMDIYFTYLGVTSGSPFIVNVNKTPTQTTIESDWNPSIYGGSVNFTAKVWNALRNTPAIGVTVEFYEGAALLGSATTDVNGFATITLTTLSAGTHPIDAVFHGDAYYQGSDTDPNHVSQVVGKANTLTSIASDTNPSLRWQNVTFTATVVYNYAFMGIPTGTVEFFDGATSLGTDTLVVIGGVPTASITVSTLSAGTHSIIAEYLGDSNYFGSVTATPVSQVVDKVRTLTSIASDTNPSLRGQNVTFTATVIDDQAFMGTPTGTVEFFDGATSLGTDTLVVIGGVPTASITVSTLSAGTHSIIAEYLGDSDYNGSVSATPVDQVVDKVRTATTLTTNPNPALLGWAVTFTATVIDDQAFMGTPTGTVEFYDGLVMIGDALLNASGVAEISTSLLTVGTHQIIAVYLGDLDYDVSDSNVIDQIIRSPEKDFYITATAYLEASISPIGKITAAKGSNATFTFSASSVTVDGRSLSQAEVDRGSYTFYDLKSNHTISASGKGGRAADITVAVKGGGGSIEYSTGGSPFAPYTTDVDLREGSSVVFKAVPDEGYHFKEWLLNGTSIKTPQITIPNLASPTDLQLVFEEDSTDSAIGSPLTLFAIAAVVLIAIVCVGLFLIFRRSAKTN